MEIKLLGHSLLGSISGSDYTGAGVSPDTGASEGA